jgi:2-hydroxy-3-oxopropionate reductase
MEKIGFIGLGIMGRPMALHLLKAGYKLSVLQSSAAVNELQNEGAYVVNTPKEMAQNCNVIITCLPDSPEVEAIVLGENGIIEGLSKRDLYIDMSTIAPATAIKLYNTLGEKEVESLDAPISGGEGGAISASLSIMVGGSQKAFERAMPIFEKMGKNIVRIGEAGSGQVTKACNQVVVAMTIQGVCEALNLARQSGVDVAKVREALLGGFAQSRILDVHGQRILEGNFKPGFKIDLHKKDMNIALQTGKENNAPLPGSTLVKNQMDAMIERGDGSLDHSALSLLLK